MTICIFLNLVPNLGNFIIFTKFCNQTNLRVLTSNTTIFFSNSRPKIPKSSIFGFNFKDFIFASNLAARQISIFKFHLKSTQIKHSWLQIQAFLFLHEILILYKLDGADFKHDNIYFKFQSKITQIRHFWSQIQAFLLFLEILQLQAWTKYLRKTLVCM